MFEDANSSSSEITHGPNSVMIDGIMYYFHYDSLEFSIRQWYIISAEPAENFTSETRALQTNLILFYSLFGIFTLSLAIGIAVFQANRFSQYEEKVENLSELLPICANCKKIRDDEGYWTNVKEYFKMLRIRNLLMGYALNALKNSTQIISK